VVIWISLGKNTRIGNSRRMIIKFDKQLVESKPELYEYVDNKSIWAIIYFLIDTNARKSEVLQEWLKDFVRNPSEELKKACDSITSNKNPDYVMTDILRYVQKNVKYVGDNTKWKMADKWQSPTETLTSGTGDCEDGAILIYCMAILKGVPSNRLLLMCGDVDGGGHCWVGYRPTEYPLNWCFMDWCYWYDPATPNSRTKYYIKDQTIYDDPKKQYFNIWFAFNHLNSYRGLMNSNVNN
jgi:hypothetical protein